MTFNAYYGLSQYGDQFHYGIEDAPDFEVDRLLVESFDYGSLIITWPSPSGPDWTNIRLVRSSIGPPVVIDEGRTVYESARETDGNSYIDEDNIEPGEVYYYGLFVLESTGLWRFVAPGQGTPLKDWGYRDRLWELIPETYRISDQVAASIDTYHDKGPLQRFLEVFAQELDYIRSEYENLRNTNNFEKVPAQLLGPVSQQLNLTIEPLLGVSLTRRFLQNALFVYKRKGSLRGVEALVSAVTGWSNDARWNPDEANAGANPRVVIRVHPDRINLLPNPSFEFAEDPEDPNDYIQSWGTKILDGNGDPINDNTSPSKEVKSDPDWGYGGSIETLNVASPFLIDLEGWDRSKAAWIPGTAGNYFSTVDKPSLDITGPLQVEWEGAVNDWDRQQTLIAKWDATTNNRSWSLYTNSSGVLQFAFTADGSTQFTAVGPDISAYVERGLQAFKVHLEFPGSGYVVSFYAADNIGGPWTEVGSVANTSGPTSVFSGTADLSVGAVDDGATTPFKGAVTRARVYSGIGGTLVADFDPRRYTSGTAFVGSKGNQWLINESGTPSSKILDRNCFAFTGSEYLIATARESLNTNNLTALVVWNRSGVTPSSHQTIMSHKAGPESSSAGWLLRNQTNDAIVGLVSDGITDETTGGGGQAIGVSATSGWNAHVLKIRVADDTLSMTVQDTYQTSATRTKTPYQSIHNNQNFSIGALPAGGAPFLTEHVQAVVLVNSQLSSDEVEEFKRWAQRGALVSEEPNWIRTQTTFYINADDDTVRQNYLSDNDVHNLSQDNVLHGNQSVRLEAINAGSVLIVWPDSSGYAYAVYGASLYGQKLYNDQPRDVNASVSAFDLADAEALRRYVFAGHVKSKSTSRPVTLAVIWYDVDRVPIDAVTETITTTPGAWKRLNLFATAPENARFVSVAMEIHECDAGEVHFVDAFMLEQSSILRDYFDGSSVPADDYTWEIIPNTSKSFFWDRIQIKTSRLIQLLPDFLPPNMVYEIEYDEREDGLIDANVEAEA